MHGFPFGYASGWYQIGWSAEWRPGTVTPLRYFGTELVAWRNTGGLLHVSDAFCLHLGAHLGYGGVVEDDCLECPFHGWKWDGDGRNVDIPYSEPERMKLRIEQWPTAEVDGLALVWYGVDGEQPTWGPPKILPDAANVDEDYWPVWPECGKVWEGLRFPPQVAVENSADAAHFHYVHGAASVPVVEKWEEGDTWFHTSFEATFGGHAETTWATPKGPVDGRISTTCHGMGLAAGHIESFDEVYTLASTTPIDEHTSDHRATVWVPKVRGDGSPLDSSVRDRWANQQISQHAADFPVWENMLYIERPPFARTEARAFRPIRRWVESLYPSSPATE